MTTILATCLLAHAWLFPAAVSLTGLYIVCLIVGGGLLLISTFLGGDAETDLDMDVDVDVDAGVDADVDADVEADSAQAGSSALALSNWFSMSFLIYFTACFGVVGTVLSFTTAMSSNMVLLVSVLSGLVVGQGVHQLMRRVKKAEALAPASERDYINKLARVTVAVAQGKIGEVALTVRGRECFVSARTRHNDENFNVGDRVVVVAFNNGTAEVVSKKEFEFVTDSKAGDSYELDYITRSG